MIDKAWCRADDRGVNTICQK